MSALIKLYLIIQIFLWTWLTNVAKPAWAENTATKVVVVAPLEDYEGNQNTNGIVSDDNLTINDILRNITLFNTEDESNEYDASMALIMENVTHTCLANCIEEETQFLNDFGLVCKAGDSRAACYRTRCFKGCELWWNALKEFEPCQEACSSTQFYPYDLPCISACEASQRQYWHFQRLHVERLLTTIKSTTTTTNVAMLLQPQLLHDNETLNTLTLKWPIITTATATKTTTFFSTLLLANRPFNIQYQYVLRAYSPPPLPSPSPLPSSLAVNDPLGINSEPTTETEQQQQQQQLKKILNVKNQRQTSFEQANDDDNDEIENVNVDNDSVDGDVKEIWQPQQENEDEQQQQQQQKWWNLADYNCNENFECDIMDGLMPYTSYRFRFMLPFGDNTEDVLYSSPSAVYTTPAMGKPISKPVFLQTISLDDTHLVIFFQPGKFINGPLMHYRVVLKSSKEVGFLQEKLLSPNSTYYIFSNLSASTIYTIELSMLNSEGEGPHAEVNLTTQASLANVLKQDELNSLILAGEYSIILKSLDPLVENRVLYKSEEILMDFDLHQYSKRLFVVDKTGEIKSFLLDDPANYTVIHLQLQEAGFMTTKLSVDWLNQKLFVAGVLPSAKTWQLLRCDFNGSSMETIVYNFKPIKQLEVDPLNGWLFALDEEQKLWKIDLYSWIPENIQLPYGIDFFSNHYHNYLLTTFNAGQREIHEISFDAGYVQKLPVKITTSFQSDVLWFLHVQDWLIMTNGSHLLRQHIKFQQADILAFKDIEWCLKFKPLLKGVWKNILQPKPKPLKEPGNLQALLSDNKAKIAWQAPVRLNFFQTPAAWQNWEYELDILDVLSNNAFNIRSIKTTHFQVERLQANNLYRIKVRAMFPGLPRLAMSATFSEWSQELTTRTWPMGDHSFLWATTNGLWESEELLKTPHLKALEGLQILNFKQVNSSLFYIEKKENSNLLKCLNLMNPEVRCGFQQENVFSVDYDWRAGKFYWSDRQRNCLVRANLKGDNKELLPIFDARLIQVDSLKGYIYYSTETRLLRKKLNGGLPGQELEYYHSSGSDESLQGFSLDLPNGWIYWWVQHQEGNTKIYRSDLDFAKMEVLQNFQKLDFTLRDSFVYIKELESFLWLEGTGKKAILTHGDHYFKLTNLPLEFADTKVNFVNMKRDFVVFPDLSVIPEGIDPESVLITEGYWDDFNIKWSPVNMNDNFSISYKVLIMALKPKNDLLLSFEVTQPLVRITEFKMSGYFINVTITPFSWWSLGPTVTVQLKTPSAAPKQPKNLRVFVEQIREPLQLSTNITALVRWDSPDNISSEKEVFYKVYCWLHEDLHSVRDVEDMGLLSHEIRFYNLKREESYMFQVQAFSLTRSKGGEKTALLTHFINPEQQAVPKLLLATGEYIAELDLDLNTTKQWVFTSSEVEHLSVLTGEQRLIWVNENVELMTYQPGSPSLKLARMRAEVLSLAVDWILRKVYWAEMSGEVEHVVNIYELDLNNYEGKVLLGNKIFSLNLGKHLRDLIAMPYSSSLLWLEYDFGFKNCSLRGLNLTDFTSLKFKHSLGLIAMFEGSFASEMETVNLVDLNGKLYSFELQRQLLTALKLPEQPYVSDSKVLYERDSGFIYTFSNQTIKAFNRRKHNMEYGHFLPEVKLIKAFNYQEYPKRECLIVESPREIESSDLLKHLFIVKVTEDYLLLKLSSQNPFEQCKQAIPGLNYRVIVQDFGTYERVYDLKPGLLNITDLKPFTNYTVEIKSNSYYQQKYQLPEMIYPAIEIRTLEGNPSKPENFSVQALSPTEILVSWLDPKELNAELVSYQLYWQLFNSSLSSHKTVEGYEVLLQNLEPDQYYQIWLEVYSLPTKLNTSERLMAKTYPEPKRLQLIEPQAYNLTLLWPDNFTYESVILECQPMILDKEDLAFSVDITNVTTNVTITNLLPKTKYEFYIRLIYRGVQRVYIYPELSVSRYIFETLGDAPSRPGQPQIEHITGEIFKVFWEAAKDNGATILEYSLEALQARQHKRIRRQALSNNSALTSMDQLPWVEELKPLEDKWLSYCNTSELSCIVRELHTMHLLMFRVRARNEPYGWGPYSEESERVLEPFVSAQKRHSLVAAIIAPAAIVTTCVIILFIIRKVQKRRLKAKLLLAKSRPSIWSNISTLQQQLAERNRAFSLTSNSTMYTGGPLSDADIALLPHINWSQITLLNFLGSGAFGEVYEGMLKHEGEEEMEKVAVKSLRKGASEFAELLQEAQLMSNFRHENIVRLIGVCCETESISIIMEHMEGGDLLSYLRESRPNSTKPVASLQLLDLMSMCIDVATGMAYLEDMHFVHRDLACRNCLVSSRIPSKRTVKIGDFGLARDIYKNDYYRKEGEALMPVRWMAPESLVDGVFTTQSDVWAFGVLCWEILTLGQQPYAARNNYEVLNFVKEGGRLQQPDNCPDKLFSLMLECWRSEAEERPTFRKCLNTLLAIKTDVRRVSMGYNIDDSDYAMYANQHGIVLSTFLTAAGLSKVKEEDESHEKKKFIANGSYKHKNEIEQNSLNSRNEQETANDKHDLKVKFNNNISHIKEVEEQNDSHNDESQLIDAKLYRIQENPDYYINEGVSRL